MKTSNKDIAELLRSVAAVYTLQNVNRFRIIAYEKAADTVEQLNRELYDIWQNGQLGGVAGIGPTIRQHLEEYFVKPESTHLIKTIQTVPASMFVLMKIPGIGVKKAFKLVNELKLMDEKKVLDDLLAKAQNHEIAVLDSFGEKSEADIISALTIYKRNVNVAPRMALQIAYKLALEVHEYLIQNKHVQHIDTLGSLRRMVSTIGDVDLAVISDPKYAANILDYFVKFPGTVEIDNKGAGKASIRVANGRRVDLRVAERDSYGAMLQYFTGSKAHNIKLREYALKRGYSLSEYGIKKPEDRGTKKEDGDRIGIKKFATEKEFYGFLGLDYVPPELREGHDEIELARKHNLPTLVDVSDLRGDFHTHSSYDLTTSHDLGANTYEEMAAKGAELGYEYIGLSDHNPSQSTNSADQIITILEARKAHIDNIMSKKSKRLQMLISCEVDITPNGTLALPEKALDHLDLAIVSVHSSFKLNREDQTKRILKALTYPKVKILGHPTGRLLLKRNEIDVDWPQVFKMCVERNIALEINSWFERLDLPDSLVREAKELGCQFVISTDAHAANQMDNMLYGVAVARRAGLEKKDVINTWSYEKILSWISSQKAL